MQANRRAAALEAQVAVHDVWAYTIDMTGQSACPVLRF